MLHFQDIHIYEIFDNKIIVYRIVNRWNAEKSGQHGQPHLVCQWIIQTLPSRLLARFGHGEGEIREFIRIGEVIYLCSHCHHHMIVRTHERYTFLYLFGCLWDQLGNHILASKNLHSSVIIFIPVTCYGARKQSLTSAQESLDRNRDVKLSTVATAISSL